MLLIYIFSKYTHIALSISFQVYFLQSTKGICSSCEEHLIRLTYWGYCNGINNSSIITSCFFSENKQFCIGSRLPFFPQTFLDLWGKLIFIALLIFILKRNLTIAQAGLKKEGKVIGACLSFRYCDCCTIIIFLSSFPSKWPRTFWSLFLRFVPLPPKNKTFIVKKFLDSWCNEFLLIWWHVTVTVTDNYDNFSVWNQNWTNCHNSI